MEHTVCIARSKRDNIKVWGAKILGPDKKYGFKRDFCSYSYLDSCSSKYGYFDYYIDVNPGDFIEVGEKSAYKNKKSYYKISDDGSLMPVNYKGILKEMCL